MVRITKPAEPTWSTHHMIISLATPITTAKQIKQERHGQRGTEGKGTRRRGYLALREGEEDWERNEEEGRTDLDNDRTWRQ